MSSIKAKTVTTCFARIPKGFPNSAPACVSQWIDDLCTMTEMECMCILQGKSLGNHATDVVFQANNSVKNYIGCIRSSAHLISSEFEKLFKKIEQEKWSYVKNASIHLTCHVRSLLHECNSCILLDLPGFQQSQQQIMEECAKLAQYVELHISVHNRCPEKSKILQLVTVLGETFGKVVDAALGFLIQKLVLALDTLQSVYGIRSTINDIATLAVEGEHMCYLLTREGSIESLFQICQQPKMHSIQQQVLRAIATVCCVPESFKRVENVRGLETLTKILNRQESPESVKCEAAGVVAQLTSPCIEKGENSVELIENMDDLIKALTDLCEGATSTDVFLLGTAALANMTFLDNLSSDYFLRYHTLDVIISSCRQADITSSIFVKDQVATILANIAAIQSCWKDLILSGGLDLLVHMLYSETPNKESYIKTEFVRNNIYESELSETERMHQKVAIALTRLSRSTKNAEKLRQLNVIPRLVDMCRNQKARNSSDAVLVACLAAVRKICTNCNLTISQDDPLYHLTQPRLMDSFLICTGLEESFV